jgi:hypothetical protein
MQVEVVGNPALPASGLGGLPRTGNPDALRSHPVVLSI